MRNPKAATLPILCIVLVAALLAGCGAPAAPTQTQGTNASTTPTVTDPIQTQSPTQPSDPDPVAEDVPRIPAQNVLQEGDPRTLDEWVFTNYEQTFSWRDGVGNFCKISITLPALTPVSDFAIEFNEDIAELGGYAIAEAVECQEGGYSNFLLSVSYEAYLNGDILSVLLIQQYDADYVLYRAYSFDLEDREALSTAELCEELLDMDYPSFILATNAIAAYHFTEQFGPYIEEIENQYISSDSYFETRSTTDLDVYNELLAAIPYNTVNIGARDLFVGENGEIMLIYNAPSIAGADSYPTVIPFDVRVTDWQQPSKATAYGELFSLMDYVDGAYADAYSTILLEAFLADGEDFVGYAAKATANKQERLMSFLNYALTQEQLDRFRAECRDVLDDDDITPDEKALVEKMLSIT